jgi:hypothetical protein
MDLRVKILGAAEKSHDVLEVRRGFQFGDVPRTNFAHMVVSESLLPRAAGGIAVK